MRKTRIFILLAFVLLLSLSLLVACQTDLESITASASKTGDVSRLDEIDLTYTLKPADIKDVNVTWKITAGAQHGDIVNNSKLKVSGDAPDGAQIKVVAESGRIKSNELTFTVKVTTVNLESISIQRAAGIVLPNKEFKLTYTLTPAGAAASVVWNITEGGDYAEIITKSGSSAGDYLKIKDNAQTGDTVKVQAVSGTITSNTLTFVVETDADANLTIAPVKDNVTVYFKGTAANESLNVEVYNALYQKVSGKNVTYSIKEGSSYVSINQNGYNCALTVKGHGQAVITAELSNGESVDFDVNCIRAPQSLRAPGVFAQRQNLEYCFSKADAFPFRVGIEEANVCTDVTYKFEKLTGGSFVSGDYGSADANGNITFKEPGIIKVTASSAAGYLNPNDEASVSQVFSVNEGINVYTFEQLKAKLEDPAYNGEIVNIVVLERPVPAAGQYGTYGYDLVPSIILAGNYSFNDLNVWESASPITITVGADCTIYGNNHAVNLKNLKYFPGITTDRFASVLNIHKASAAYSVTIKNLTLLGNVNVAGTSTDGAGNSVDLEISQNEAKLSGVHSRGISIGVANESEGRSTVFLSMENVTIDGFSVGMRIYYAYNSKLSNVTVMNCFSNGIEVDGSIVTFNNMAYKSCGAAGMEITPELSEKAGLNFDQPQKVSFEGTITLENLNNTGNTKYLSSYKLMGYDVNSIIGGAILGTGKDATAISNIVNAKQEMIFIAFIFQNPLDPTEVNKSVFEYINPDAGGIIEFTKINGVDTTHQYILVDIILSMFGGANAGKVLMYNHNYRAV